MADRMNIKFTIKAVDRFSATMNKLEQKLDSLKRKASDVETAREFQVDADTSNAMRDLNRLQAQINRIERQSSKPKKFDINSTEAQASIRRISSMMDGLEDERLTVNADTSNAMRALRNVDRVASDLRRENSRIRLQAELDDGPVMRTLQRVARRTDSVMNARENYALGFNTLPATRALRELNALANNTTRDRDIDIGADLNGAIAQMAALSAAAQVIDSTDPDIDVTANTRRADRALRATEAHARRINGMRVVVNIAHDGYKRFRTNMDRIATTGRNVGEIVTNTFMGMATTFSTTLVPIIASTTGMLASLGVMAGVTAGATMGLTSAFFAAGAGAAGFAAFAIPAINDLTLHMGDLQGQMDKYNDAVRSGDTEKAAKAMAEYKRILASMTDEQVAAMNATNMLKDLYNDMSEALEPSILSSYTLALSALAQLMQALSPMVTATADAVNRLMSALNVNLQSEDMIAFFEYLNTYAASSLQVVGKGLGNFLVGIFNLMTAFAPLSVAMSGGFLAMSESFRQWTASLSGSDKFKAFTDYVASTWPKIRSIFGNAIAGIIALFAGFAPYASQWMDTTKAMMISFRNFAEGLGQNQQFQEFLAYISANGPKVTALIGDLVQFLVALGVALAPVGAKMVEVASAILSFLTSLLQANPEIGHLLGWILALGGGFFTLLPIMMALFQVFRTLGAVAALFGPTLAKVGAFVARLIPGFAQLRSAFMTVRIAMMLMGGPVMWIIGILLLLVPVFMKLWQTSETFRTVMTNAFNAVKTAISTAISAIVSFVMSTWGTLTAWWAANGEMIKQAASNVWSVISTVITTAMTVIGAIIKAVWPVVLMIITSVWNNIKGVITGALNIIMGLVTAFSGLFTGNFSAMWEGIKQVFSGAVQFLWNAVQLLLWGKLIKGVMAFAGLFRGAISGMWATIKGVFSSAMSSIRSTFSALWLVLKGLVQQGIGAIKGFFTSGLSAITSRVTSGLSRIRSGFSTALSFIRNLVSTAISTIRNRFQAGMAAIVSRVTSGLSRIRSGFSNGLNAARNIVASAISAIRNRFQSGIAAIVNRVTSGLSRMVSAFRSGLDRAKSIVSSAIDRIKSLFNIDLSAQGRKIVESVARGISGAIGKVTGAISKVTEKIRNFLPFSPAKEGALRDLDRLNFGGTIAKSMSRQTGTVRRAMNDMMIAASPNVDFAVDNAYSGASTTMATLRTERENKSRTMVEVPVYLNGREIARASNDEQRRMNAREEARIRQFSRTGGEQ